MCYGLGVSSEPSESMNRALALVREGQGVAAESMMVEAAQVAGDSSGVNSPGHAAALYELACVILACGDLSRGIDAMRSACDVEANGDDTAQKDRLTYIMNLGELLLRAGRLEEAESTLQRGAAERARFYPADHPGIAYGLESLADALLARGKFEEALQAADQALRILWDAGHHRVAETLALRAEILAATGREGAFAQSSGLPDELFDAMVHTALERAGRTLDPAKYFSVLAKLRHFVVERRGLDAPMVVHVVAAMADVARQGDLHEAREGAYRWLVSAFEVQGQPARGVDALLALALTKSETGQPSEAEELYRQAIDRANELGDAAKRSSVLRNFALFLAEQQRPEAASVFADATAAARHSDDAETLGRSLLAEGIHVQHNGALETAKAKLQEALRLLPPSHPDALIGRSHLNAIEQGGSCGCGSMDFALSQSLAAIARPHLPEGLLRSVSVQLDEQQNMNLSVQLAREATRAELELLDRVLHQALAQLRQGLRAGGYN